MAVMRVVTVGAPQLANDAALPTLGAALDPALATPAIAERLGIAPTDTRLCSIRVLAYKPGRRCLVEYEMDTTTPDGTARRIVVLGKIRSKRFGNSGFRQLRALWDAGFDDQSADGISVPEPLGTVPQLCMWLQRKVAGQVATDLLDATVSGLATRIAHAVHKLHTTSFSPERYHGIDEELQILTRCLNDTAKSHPHATKQLTMLSAAAARAGALLRSTVCCPSHRDFYSDQVIVSNRRLFLIDFDLFCQADPGLDVGNFLGHVTEYALRCHGRPDALGPFERELEDQFIMRAGEGVRWAVRVYAALTVARHVYLCTRFPDRAHLMPVLLGLAQDRLDRLMADGGHA